MQRSIIAVTFAPSPFHVICAFATFADGRTAVRELKEGSGEEDPVSVVASWIESSPHPTLIAIDGPLGWPVALSKMMSEHLAGQPPRGEAEALFRRRTEHLVADLLGQTPLEAGADRVSTYAALAFVTEVRTSTGHDIPVVWNPDSAGHGVIEVLPPATLKAHRMPTGEYGGAGDTDHRYNVVVALRDRIKLPSEIGAMVANPDLLDAGLCVLAAHDFLLGKASAPSDMELARREGWIWVRDPD